MWQFCGQLVNCLPLCFWHPNRIFLSNGKHPGCLSCRFEVCVKRESTVFILHTLTQTNCYIILYLSSSGMSDHLSSWPQKASLRGIKAGLLSSSSVTCKNTCLIKFPLNTMKLLSISYLLLPYKNQLLNL